jgi:hypothetical protein
LAFGVDVIVFQADDCAPMKAGRHGGFLHGPTEISARCSKLCRGHHDPVNRVVVLLVFQLSCHNE